MHDFLRVYSPWQIWGTVAAIVLVILGGGWAFWHYLVPHGKSVPFGELLRSDPKKK